jgi:hypothetical protein
MLSEIDDKMPQ